MGQNVTGKWGSHILEQIIKKSISGKIGHFSGQNSSEYVHAKGSHVRFGFLGFSHHINKTILS